MKESLGEKTALIGFAGSPWTLANFMLEGGSATEFVHAKKLFYSEPEIFSTLMKKFTAAVTKLLQMQIAGRRGRRADFRQPRRIAAQRRVCSGFGRNGSSKSLPR